MTAPVAAGFAQHLGLNFAAREGGLLCACCRAGLHKPFLDAYLAQLLDVREISSLDVLGS